MRIWDIDTGFLNDQSLLGEHRELHGIHSVIVNHKKGYSRHPETLRWIDHLPGLALRHELIVAEMRLRGFKHHSPLDTKPQADNWPEVFIDPPGEQFEILKRKYLHKKQGRIPLPKNIQELWAAHKYSAMARDPEFYRKTGALVANNKVDFMDLAEDLVFILRTPPQQGRLVNAIQHMWGYVSDYSELDLKGATTGEIMAEIQRKAYEYNVTYLLNSSALGELGVWGKTVSCFLKID